LKNLHYRIKINTTILYEIRAVALSVCFLNTVKEQYVNLGKYISRSAVYYPDYPALIDERKSYTYKELDNRTNQLAQGLLSLGVAQRGIK